jgi:hypothetical protein
VSAAKSHSNCFGSKTMQCWRDQGLGFKRPRHSHTLARKIVAHSRSSEQAWPRRGWPCGLRSTDRSPASPSPPTPSLDSASHPTTPATGIAQTPAPMSTAPASPLWTSSAPSSPGRWPCSWISSSTGTR